MILVPKAYPIKDKRSEERWTAILREDVVILSVYFPPINTKAGKAAGPNQHEVVPAEEDTRPPPHPPQSEGDGGAVEGGLFR